MPKKVVCENCEAFEVNPPGHQDREPYKGKCRLKAPKVDDTGAPVFPSVDKSFWCFEGMPIGGTAPPVEPAPEPLDNSPQTTLATGWYSVYQDDSTVHFFAGGTAQKHEAICGALSACEFLNARPQGNPAPCENCKRIGEAATKDKQSMEV